MEKKNSLQIRVKTTPDIYGTLLTSSGDLYVLKRIITLL